MSTMTEAAGLLENAGFEDVPTDLPGTWATDDEWTVVIQTRPVHGGPVEQLCHRVLVYEGPPPEINHGTPLAGEATATSIESATRDALWRAGYPVPTGAGQ